MSNSQPNSQGQEKKQPRTMTKAKQTEKGEKKKKKKKTNVGAPRHLNNNPTVSRLDGKRKVEKK
jgi:hypothetical protein